MVPLGEWHLRQAISEYMRHYHSERNHQGLENALIAGNREDAAASGRNQMRIESATPAATVAATPTVTTEPRP
jgi:hypothetical protein